MRHDGRMPARRVIGDRSGWERVADAVVKRREALGLTAAQVVERGGDLSTSLLSLIENHHQDVYLARKLAAVCRALGWTPDSIERILAGDEPVEATASDKPARQSVDERLRTLERRLGITQADVASKTNEQRLAELEALIAERR